MDLAAAGLIMKELVLTTNKICLVDDEDFSLLSRYTWRSETNTHGNTYVFTRINVAGRSIKLYIHRLIMNPPNNKVVDHKDSNGLITLKVI